MTVYSKIPIENNDPLDAVRAFLVGLLEKGLASGILVPVETGDGRSVHPALIIDPARLARANPLMPVLPVSAARMATLLGKRGAAGAGVPGRIAVVMRPCELRAAVELAKLRQVDPERLLTIGIDCAGTFETSVFQAADEPDALTRAALAAARAGRPEAPGGLSYRPACRICVTPAPWQADIRLHFIGTSAEEGLLVEVEDASVLAGMDLVFGADPAGHLAAVEDLLAVRRPLRTAGLDAFRADLQPNGVPGIFAATEACRRCLNCTTACPICYCVECLFQTRVFAQEPARLVSWAQHRGATRLPADTLTFQLTRLTHVTASCVGCGLCTSACPAGLPVDTLFQTVARDMQARFDYIPGRDPDEALPAAVFRPDEFVELGEREIRVSREYVSR